MSLTSGIPCCLQLLPYLVDSTNSPRNEVRQWQRLNKKGQVALVALTELGASELLGSRGILASLGELQSGTSLPLTASYASPYASPLLLALRTRHWQTSSSKQKERDITIYLSTNLQCLLEANTKTIQATYESSSTPTSRSKRTSTSQRELQPTWHCGRPTSCDGFTGLCIQDTRHWSQHLPTSGAGICHIQTPH